MINLFGLKKGKNRGEALAARYLRRHGHKILQQNYYEKCGEIDIISLEKDVLVFTEVKQRKTDRFGRPEDFVTASKRDKLRKTAQLFIMKNKYKGNARFDIVEVLGDDKPEIRHIKNAF
ncbi:MAG: YraN family protein [Clostridia bacterium]|nr:YraN family protein [Clostridia bacterium]